MPEGQSDPRQSPRQFGDLVNQILWIACGSGMLATLALINQLATGLAEITALGLVMPVVVGGMAAFTLRYFVFRSNRLLRERLELENLMHMEREVRERKNAEEGQRETQETMRALADNLPEFITLKDSERRFLFVNKRFEEWTGLKRHDIVGKTVHDIYRSEQAAEFDALDRKAMTDQSILARETDIDYPDGNTRTVISTRFPILSSSSKTTGLGTVNIDISDLKRAEKDLESKEAQLRFVFDNMTSGILMVDERKVIRAINKNMIELYGFPIDVVEVGQPFSNIIHFRAKRGDYGPGDPDHQIAERLEMWKPGGTEIYEDIIPAGPVIEVLRAWTADGGAVMVANDITERKQAEKEIEAQRDELEILNQQKNKLFSIIGHDLKNPFTSLLGMSKIMAQLSDKLTPEQFSDYAKSINESGERLFVLLENLLEWSRSQMDQVSIERQPQELKALVDDTLELLSNSAEDKGIQFVNRVPETMVYVDFNLVSTVIRNLLSNAIKFTSESGRISIGALEIGDWIELSVTDTGVGMSAERIESLFKVDSAQSTRGTKGESGTGLGLLLCKDFIERHGGNIWAESEIGKGSSFHFTLPMYRESAQVDRAPDS